MIRIGIIGAGPNAAGHAKYYGSCPRTKLIAVADPDAVRADKVASECSTKSCRDFTEFLGDVDAVVISSPNFLHLQHAVESARAGRHVYCEKPMGVTGDEARQIAEAINKAGVKSAVGFSVRFDPTIQTAMKMISDGKIGRLISVWSRRLTYSNFSGARGWRADHSKSGGIMLEINVHELDWMMAVGGPVKGVFAQMRAEEPAGPRRNDYIWFTLMFDSGAVGSHEGSWHSAAANYFRGLYGDKGAAYTDEWGGKIYHAIPGVKDRTEVALEPKFDLRGHFLDCIEKGAEPVADVNWGLKVMTVAEAIFKSAAENEVVRLD
ncbi:MAG: Gfo/Idh/MocA family oxidoreductase [Planctomycetes bacterium]|nr:Gfo/Idh/MocA family oxidoreductase [Planctomycetota bacterium]